MVGGVWLWGVFKGGGLSIFRVFLVEKGKVYLDTWLVGADYSEKEERAIQPVTIVEAKL